MSGFGFRSKRHEHPFRTMQYAKLMQLEETAPDMKPALTRDEAIFARVFLRRYVTWCARSRHYDRIAAAKALYRRLG